MFHDTEGNIKEWSKYVDKLKHKNNNILSIGSQEGKIDAWLLINLCQNENSKVYSVDIWSNEISKFGKGEYKYCSDYVNLNKIEKRSKEVEKTSKEVEKIFDDNIKKTQKSNQLIKMKVCVIEGLIKLIEKKEKFDFIHINSLYLARDLMTDGIFCWKLLKEDGIIVFSDYGIEEFKGHFYKQKYVIDTFLEIYEPEMKILFKKQELVIEKLSNEVIGDIEKRKYCYIKNDIEKYLFSIINDKIFYENNNKLSYNLVFGKKDIYLDEYIYKNIVKVYEKFKDISKNMTGCFNPIIINNKLQYSYEFNYVMKKNGFTMVEFLLVVEYNSIVKLLKYIGFKNKSLFMTTRKHLSNAYINFLKNITENTMTIDYLDTYLKFMLIEDYNKIIEDKKKYDILYLSLGTRFSYTALTFEVKYNNNANLLMNLKIALNKQKIGGAVIFNISLITSEFISDLVYIIKKYYKKVIISNVLSLKFEMILTINAIDFIGISSYELNEFNKICNKITNNNLNPNAINNTLIRILNIKNDDETYKNIRDDILKFSYKCIGSLNVNYRMYQNIVYFMEDKKNSKKLKEDIFKLFYGKIINILFSAVYGAITFS